MRIYDGTIPLQTLWERKIRRPLLFMLLSSRFPEGDPIHRSIDFVERPMSYRFGHTRVDVKATPQQISDRLDMICGILTSLSDRNKGLPVFPIRDVYNAFSVIACNWLSIHGCLGYDGHGRALASLLPITLGIGGYSSEFIAKEFTNLKGEFDMLSAKAALGYLNGHIWPGVRIVAAGVELDAHGDISPLLRNRSVIVDSNLRRKATLHALSVVLSKYRPRA